MINIIHNWLNKHVHAQCILYSNHTLEIVKFPDMMNALEIKIPTLIINYKRL